MRVMIMKTVATPTLKKLGDDVSNTQQVCFSLALTGIVHPEACRWSHLHLYRALGILPWEGQPVRNDGPYSDRATDMG